MFLSPTSLIMTWLLVLVSVPLPLLAFSADNKITRYGKGYCFDMNGMPLDADKFLYRHPQRNYLLGDLFERTSQPWTDFIDGRTK